VFSVYTCLFIVYCEILSQYKYLLVHRSRVNLTLNVSGSFSAKLFSSRAGTTTLSE